jgi:hypothetical protein
MKHHFGDFLDRKGDYWTTIPNRERFAFIADFEIANKGEVKILTISKNQDSISTCHKLAKKNIFLYLKFCGTTEVKI